MFQKELGEKIISKFPASRIREIINFMWLFRLSVIEKFLVSPNCFIPRPKVKSMVIHFKPKRKINVKIKNMKNLERVTNILFSNKRKMINKNIKRY